MTGDLRTRLEALHQPESYEHEGGSVRTYCRECSTFSRRAFVTWPCPTMRVLDADPDTPTTEPCNCHQYGHARLCPIHTQEDFDAAEVTRARPDAPVDDGKDKLDANLSDRASDDSDALLVEQIARTLADHEWFHGYYCKCGDLLNSIPGYREHVARALVVARPWQAEVPHDDQTPEDATTRRIEAMRRDRAARGETRQP